MNDYTARFVWNDFQKHWSCYLNEAGAPVVLDSAHYFNRLPAGTPECPLFSFSDIFESLMDEIARAWKNRQKEIDPVTDLGVFP